MSDNVIAFPTAEEREAVPEPDAVPDPDVDFDGWLLNEMPTVMHHAESLDALPEGLEFWQHARDLRDQLNRWPIPD